MANHIASSLKRDAWIRCADEMPPQMSPVIAYRKGRVGIGEWMQRDDGKVWIWNGTSVHEQLATAIPKLSCAFTHWMPLPEKPK